MQALLASPSQFSPPPSPTDSGSPSSPALPALSSPFNPHQPDWDEYTHDTPTRSTSTVSSSMSSSGQPAWMTDALEEEWVEQDSSSDEDRSGEDDANSSGGLIETPLKQHSNGRSREPTSSGQPSYSLPSAPPSSSRSNSSYRTSSSSISPTIVRPGSSATYASVNKPRVPSSLRYAFTSSLTASSASTSTINEDDSHTHQELEQEAVEIVGAVEEDLDDEEANGSPASSSAGTFVMKSSPSISSSYKIRGGPGPESQLQAAVRALKGPSGGLGGKVEEEGDSEAAVEDVEEGEVMTPAKMKKGMDKLGLMKLFDPPSPPQAYPLPPSTTPAPTASAFTFSQPSLPRTTLASISRLTPPPKSTSNQGDSTPLARQTPHYNQNENPFDADATPTRPTPRNLLTSNQTAPAPNRKERYLRSEQAQSQNVMPPPALPPSPALSHASSHSSTRSQPPFPTTPAPRPTNEQDGTDIGTPISAQRSQQLRLFEFQYDTFTRDHLTALVDEIDELNSGSASGSNGMGSFAVLQENEREEREWEASFVDVVQNDRRRGDDEVEGDDDEEDAQRDGDLSDELGAGRSTKRIRLSPREWDKRGALGERNGTVNSSGSLYRGRTARRQSPTSTTASQKRRKRSSTFVRTTPAPSTPTPPSSSFGSVPRSPQPLRSNRSSASARSIPFAKSFDDSARVVPTPSATRTAPIVDAGGRKKAAAASSVSTRDRLGEANSLLDRIRAKMAKKEERKESDRVVEAAEGQHDLALQPYPDELQLGDEKGEVEMALWKREKSLSPRKMLRRLSAADEVDEEIRQLDAGDPLLHSTPPPSTSEDHLPRLAAAASASLRSALGDTVSSVPTSSIGHGRKLSESTPGGGRRHFARTPISHKRAPRSRLDGIFNGRATVPTGVGEGSSGESDKESNATPSHARHSSLTTIAPTDVEALLASTGTPSRMIFDKEQGKWIKGARPQAIGRVAHVLQEEEGEGANESASTEDDPFRDFDSTKGSDLSRPAIAPDPSTVGMRSVTGGDIGLSGLGIKGASGTPMTPAVVVSPPDANHFQSPPIEIREDGDEMADDERDSVPSLWGRAEDPQSELEETDDLELVQGEEATGLMADESPYHLFKSLQPLGNDPTTNHLEKTPDVPETSLPTDLSQPFSTALTSPTPAAPPSPLTPRPVPATSRSTPTVIPRSVLKPTPLRSQSAPGLTTPTGPEEEARPPRSVSFSDGKTSGKIEGLEFKAPTGGREGSHLKFEMGGNSDDGGIEYGEPGSLELAEEPSSPDAVSPTPSARSKYPGRALKELQAGGIGNTSHASSSASSVLISSFEGAPKVRPRPSRSASSSRTFRRTTAADATFLTECSFGVSHELLIRHITDVEPFEPDWEGLHTIDMSGKGLEGVVRLKEFLPMLDDINLANNEIGYLTGLPSTLRTLLISTNKLSGLSSFSHLRNLERLDLSNNQIESVHQLSCLRHLRELKADNNQIADLGGLADIDGLLKLSLQGNALESVDFTATKWTKLESLNLSWNKVSTVLGLERLQSLVMLNFDHNVLQDLTSGNAMPHLRVLRTSFNPIKMLDVSLWPKLRTLFVDSGRLGSVQGTDRLRKLENLSVRDQHGEALTLSMHQVRDVKRLYLSGNPLPMSFPNEQFFNLVYLELAMCQLTALPPNLASLIPNVRALNLNFNFLEDLTPLTGLTRLKKLTIVGARLARCRPVAQVLGSMTELELVDLRMNPMTLAYYPPLMLQQGTETLPPHANYEILHPDDDCGPSPQSHQWTLVDHKFRRALPDTWYFKRVAYRGALLQTCQNLRALDGIDCMKERPKLAKALAALGRERGDTGRIEA